jgi:hypothetical protein
MLQSIISPIRERKRFHLQCIAYNLFLIFLNFNIWQAKNQIIK